jgi:hypothetical protein
MLAKIQPMNLCSLQENIIQSLTVFASQDVTLNGQYSADEKDLVDVLTELEYSTDNNKKLSLSGKVQDSSRGNVKHYNFEILGSHPATR